MPRTPRPPLVAVDIGNSRIKLAAFDDELEGALPEPRYSAVVGLDWTAQQLEQFSDDNQRLWAIASVNRPAAERLAEWLNVRGVRRVLMLSAGDLPLAVDVAERGAVGLDRLANAVAANRLRATEQMAVVIDSGSAITVDMLSTAGAFVGGAIAPGIAMAARALHEFTDLLPLVEVVGQPAALGDSTVAAIRSGLYWGAVGTVRELVTRLTADCRQVQVFLTGGAPSFADLLADDRRLIVHCIPHLTLAGVALSAWHAIAAKAEP